MRPINLLPRADRAAATARRRTVLVVIVGLLYVAGLAGLTMVWNGKVDVAEQNLANQQAINQELQAEVAAYAAAEAEVLPVDAQITASAPAETATDIATVIPRSLKDAVGLRPSYLSNRRPPNPTLSASRGASMSGVSPSRSVTALTSASIGSRSRNSSITPRHIVIAPPIPVSQPLNFSN